MRRLLGSVFGGGGLQHSAHETTPPTKNSVAVFYGRVQETLRSQRKERKPGYVTEPEDLLRLMNAIEPEDVGAQDARQALARRAPAYSVGYVPIVESPECNLCLFVLGPSAVIPLHDHPHMTVLSRLLFGSLEVASFDVVGISPSNAARGPGLAARRYEPERFRAPCDAVALYPDLRNCHRFCAGPDGAVVLDLLAPSYGDDRQCTYYSVVDESPNNGGPDDDVVLAVCDEDPDFACATLPYTGLSPFSSSAQQDPSESATS